MLHNRLSSTAHPATAKQRAPTAAGTFSLLRELFGLARLA